MSGCNIWQDFSYLLFSFIVPKTVCIVMNCWVQQMLLRALFCLKQSSWILLSLLFKIILKRFFFATFGNIYFTFSVWDTFQRTSQMFTEISLCLLLSQEYINVSDMSIWVQTGQLNFNTASHLVAWERLTICKITCWQVKCIICASYLRCTQ